MKTVFLDLDTVSNRDIELEAITATGVDLVVHGVTSDEQIDERLADAEIVITNKKHLDRARLTSAGKLKLVCLVATGTNNVDLDAATDLDIGVCNIVAYCTASVVQHVFAMILSLTHRLNDYQALLREGSWRDSPQFCMLDYPIRELEGRTIGIVGHGELGSAVARVAGAFGMRVMIAQRPGGEPATDRTPLDELLGQADIVSLHCPLTDATRNLIADRELELMKSDALLINTARGALVDSAALAQALREGRIGGAGIDVLAEEPPISGDALIDEDLPNLIVTPHIAWAATEARQRALDEVARNIRSFLDGDRRGRVV
jgi:glycerate dehydrogenase